jgi:small-conductance mechanosensitive channel/CRP-like cAMP-binding protein
MIWAFLITLILLLARVFGGPLFAHYVPGHEDNLTRVITAALIISYAIFIDRVIRRYYWEGHLKQRRGRETPKLVQDIVTVLLVAVGIAIALWWQEGLTVTGIAATSIAIAAGIGVALQPDIQDIASGLFINFEGSYSIGDWVTVNSSDLKEPVYGIVINQGWRSCFLELEDGTRASIPNHYFTSNIVINHSHPVGPKKLIVEMGVDNRLPASRVMDMFLGEAFKAIRHKGLARHPEPEVLLQKFTSDSAIYHVHFWSSPHEINPENAKSVMLRALQDVMLQNELPTPVTQVELTKAPDVADRLGAQEIHDALKEASLFRNALDDEQRQKLAELSRPLEFSRGSVLMRQGDAANAMYIILEGAMSISINGHDGQQQEVAISATGDVVGEMSVMTGAPRTATATALTRTRVIEITKEDIADLLKLNPELFERFSSVLAQRQLELDALANRRVDKGAVENDILARMRSFFSRAFGMEG